MKESTISAAVNRRFYGTSAVKRIRRTAADIQALDDALVAIVEEQKPVTVRQTFYQATVRGLVPKDEKQGYRPVQRRLVALRESGRLSYWAITDNLRQVTGYRRYGGVQEFAGEVAKLFRRDYWREADCQVEVWIEKDALASVISRVVCDEWGLDLHVARGFSSLSYLHASAEALASDGRPAFIYVLTDLDPSGIHIARDIETKLTELVSGRVALHVERLAVDPWQVTEWNLPTRPTKKSRKGRGDSRAPKYREQFGDQCVELDAIPAPTLRQLVSDAICRHADPDAIAALKRTEELERESIRNWQAAMGGGSSR
jgi:hypothetical protein